MHQFLARAWSVQLGSWQIVSVYVMRGMVGIVGVLVVLARDWWCDLCHIIYQDKLVQNGHVIFGNARVDYPASERLIGFFSCSNKALTCGFVFPARVFQGVVGGFPCWPFRKNGHRGKTHTTQETPATTIQKSERLPGDTESLSVWLSRTLGKEANRVRHYQRTCNYPRYPSKHKTLSQL